MSKFQRWLVLSLSITLFATGPVFAEQKSEKVLATVNGTTITLNEFNSSILELPSDLRKRAEQNKLDFLQYSIRKELLYQEGVRRGIDKDPRIVDMINQYQHEIIIQQYLDKNMKGVGTVTDKEVKDYYQKHISLFQTKEEITASHILVKTEKEAEGILEELKKGKDFFELAKKRSADPSSAREGGRLGTFGRGVMVPEFEKAAFSLKIGEISPIVKSEFGYHIIKLTDYTKPQKLDFIQVKDRIRQSLIHEKTQKAISKLVDKLIKNAKIEINEENLR
jgi:peptidyl-prolyl cis-trans isomerase C